MIWILVYIVEKACDTCCVHLDGYSTTWSLRCAHNLSVAFKSAHKCQLAYFTVNQLEDERTTGYDARSSGQEVPERK